MDEEELQSPEDQRSGNLERFDSVSNVCFKYFASTLSQELLFHNLHFRCKISKYQ